MSTYSIDYIRLQRMRNTYHVAFHGNIVSELSNNDLTEVYGVGLDQRYSAALKAEQDVVNRSMASEYTAVLAEKDTIRDNYYRKIIYTLKCVLLDTENTSVTDAIRSEVSTNILNAYSLDMANKANQEETAIIRGFIQDLRALPADDLKVLNIDSDLVKLEDANNEYETNFMNRVHEYSVASDAKPYREATDDLYNQICLAIATEANLVTTDETEQAKVTLAQTVVTDINTLVKVYKAKMNSASNTDTAEDITAETTEDANKTEA